MTEQGKAPAARTAAMTVGSLFSGIGGLDLGLERAGMRVLWQVEIDPYCRRVLEKHWPDVTRYEDVRNVGAAELVPVDLVCGGFPCQDISIAGGRAGIDGPKSGLWTEFARIIRGLRPRYALMENSPALTHGGLGRVLGDLASSGYDAEWDCLPAGAFGAPHLRDRIFIVAHAGRAQERWRKSGWRGALSEEAPQAAANTDAVRELQPSRRIFDQRRRPVHDPWWASEPDVGRVVHGLPSRMDRAAGLGNAVVPQVAEYIGRCILKMSAATAAEPPLKAVEIIEPPPPSDSKG